MVFSKKTNVKHKKINGYSLTQLNISSII